MNISRERNTEIIPDCSEKAPQAVIKGKVSHASVIHSDRWREYNGLVDMELKNIFASIMRLGNSQLKKGTHINRIENFWSFIKRRLAQFNSVKNNFELHLKECEWCYGKDHRTLLREINVIFKYYIILDARALVN